MPAHRTNTENSTRLESPRRVLFAVLVRWAGIAKSSFRGLKNVLHLDIERNLRFQSVFLVYARLMGSIFYLRLVYATSGRGFEPANFHISMLISRPSPFQCWRIALGSEPARAPTTQHWWGGGDFQEEFGRKYFNIDEKTVFLKEDLRVESR